MHRLQAGIIGLILSGSLIALAEPAPVKYLTGQTEAGQPHLYWFGAAAVENPIEFDDGVPNVFANVSDFHTDNQALIRVQSFLPSQPILISEIKALVAPSTGSDSSMFILSVRRDTGSSVPGEYLFLDTVAIDWNGQSSFWASAEPFVSLFEEGDFWAGLQWMPATPSNPLLGRDYSDPGPTSYICTLGVCSPPYLGLWMIRAKVMHNDSAAEAADGFRVYRGVDSNSIINIATVGPGQFDYLDSPPTSGVYFYRVSRLENGVESPMSKAIQLTASPTSVEGKETGKHAFLLSEPFPNPTSAGVLFTTRTDKQMELGFSIYNLLGQKVYSRPAAGYPAGEHRFFWDGQEGSGRRLPSGMYLLRFQAGEEVLVKKITLLR
ncbi:MAG TPA: T9SS type A sorting domain-containing protein [Verrucomicrobiae bacterium]|nr:T9SS type A sorting domain-containing protein [Verrucomicrobiae bacterium]